jgi:transposase
MARFRKNLCGETMQKRQEALRKAARDFEGGANDTAKQQQIIAEVGANAATFPSVKHLSCWVGACPGDEETAEVHYRRRSPLGNCYMRRILNQAANAAAKHKGSIFEILYRRYVPRLGHNQTMGIIAYKLCRLVWKILRRGIGYEERGVSKASMQKRTRKMIRQLRRLGYQIEPSPSPSAITA